MVDSSESQNPFSGKRKDLFGFIDLVALDPDRGTIGIQVTSGSNHAARRKKILTDCREAALMWLRCNNLIEIWSWSKRKVKRGGKAVRWTPRVEQITLESFDGDT